MEFKVSLGYIKALLKKEKKNIYILIFDVTQFFPKQDKQAL